MSQCTVPTSWNLSSQSQEQVGGCGGGGGEEMIMSSTKTNNRSVVQSSYHHHHVHHTHDLLHDADADAAAAARLVPMSCNEVAELTWENGQLGMHGLGGFLNPAGGGGPSSTKPTWDRPMETLESIVHHATIKTNNNPPPTQTPRLFHHYQPQDVLKTPAAGGNNVNITTSSAVASSDGKWATTTSGHHLGAGGGGGPMEMVKKRGRSSSDNNYHQHPQQNNIYGGGNNYSSNINYGEDYHHHQQQRQQQQQQKQVVHRMDRSACGSASATATICRDSGADTTMMTWPASSSDQSPQSTFKTTKTADEDSACHDDRSENQDDDRETKAETVRSQQSCRRSRVAAVHNQSERRRRDRINQKMKALQKLVPNASKTDKASMLDEVIEYLKQLQAQVQLMSSMRNMAPQMMMPLGMQQQLQMSLLAARMGMGTFGMGIGTPQSALPHPQIFHQAAAAAAAANTSAFVPQPYAASSFLPPPGPAARPNSDPAGTNAALPPANFSDAYCALLTQSMNMELYNKMAALYSQQVNQNATQAASCSASMSKNVQAD